MSVYADIRTALTSHPGVIAQLTTRIALNAVGENTAVPYAIYRAERKPELGLAGNVLGETVMIEVQVWARTAERCIEIGDQIDAALSDPARLCATVMQRVTGYDPESLLHYEAIQATLLT